MRWPRVRKGSCWRVGRRCSRPASTCPTCCRSATTRKHCWAHGRCSSRPRAHWWRARCRWWPHWPGIRPQAVACWRCAATTGSWPKARTGSASTKPRSGWSRRKASRRCWRGWSARIARNACWSPARWSMPPKPCASAWSMNSPTSTRWPRGRASGWRRSCSYRAHRCCRPVGSHGLRRSIACATNASNCRASSAAGWNQIPRPRCARCWRGSASTGRQRTQPALDPFMDRWQPAATDFRSSRSTTR